MMEDAGIIELFFERSEQGIRELDIKYGILLESRRLPHTFTGAPLSYISTRISVTSVSTH